MKDRISQYPNRIKLTPVTGQSNVYDMERVDEPIEPGTPLNRASLLSESTQNGLSLNDDATPSDAIAKLNSIKAPAYSYGLDDLEPEVTDLETGKLYFVHE